MRENELVSQKQAEVMFEDLSNKETKKFAVLGLQSASLTEATQIEVTTIITRIVNSRNISESGIMKGVSNKDICQGQDVNHAMVHKALVQLGYVKNKQVTMKGFEASNGTGVKEVDYFTDIPLFYFTDEGSLYWNDLHPNFKKVWKTILETEIGDVAVEETTWNKQLKERNPAMPRGYMKMLQNNGVTIMKDAEITIIR